MKFRISVIALGALFAGITAQAQQKGKTQFNIQYNLALPSGSLKNQVSDISPRGAQAGVLYGISDNLSLGAGVGFQDFYQKYPRQQYKLSDGSDLSGVRTFSIQTIPILVQGKWSFSPGATVQPYAALGIGGNMINYNDYVGEFSLDRKTGFGFAAKPQAGVFVPFRKGGESGFNLGASYNIMPFKYGELNNLNHFGFNAGISIPMRR